MVKIYDEPESPMRGLARICAEPESPHMRVRVQDMCSTTTTTAITVTTSSTALAKQQH